MGAQDFRLIWRLGFRAWDLVFSFKGLGLEVDRVKGKGFMVLGLSLRMGA